MIGKRKFIAIRETGAAAKKSRTVSFYSLADIRRRIRVIRKREFAGKTIDNPTAMEVMVDNFAPLRAQFFDLIKKSTLFKDELLMFNLISQELFDESLNLRKRAPKKVVLGLGITDFSEEMNVLLSSIVHRKCTEVNATTNKDEEPFENPLSLCRTKGARCAQRKKRLDKKCKKYVQVILKYLFTNQTYASIAKETNCTYAQVRRGIEAYRRTLQCTLKRMLIPENNRRITDNHLNALRSLYENEEIVDLSLKEKAKLWAKICPELTTISRETLRMYTRKKLKIAYENLRFTCPSANSQVNRERRKIVVTRILQLMESDFNIIYLDESGVGSKPLKKYGWGNEMNYRARKSSGRVKNLSVCTAISKKGLECIEFSSTAYDENSFESYLIKMLELVQKKALNTHQKYILLMDNAAFHKTERCQTLLKKAGMSVIFIPPYTPHLNACEYFFRDMKRNLRARASTPK
jgi:transposase